MLLEQKTASSSATTLLKQTLRAVERYEQLMNVEMQKAKILEAVVQDVESGDLPESFALDTFDRIWRDRFASHSSQKKPDEMRLSIYQGRSLADAVLSIFDSLDSSRSPCLSIDELVRLIYCAKSKEEINACKSSLTAVLNRCVNSEELKRVKPGVFARNTDKQLTRFYRKEGGLALV